MPLVVYIFRVEIAKILRDSLCHLSSVDGLGNSSIGALNRGGNNVARTRRRNRRTASATDEADQLMSLHNIPWARCKFSKLSKINQRKFYKKFSKEKIIQKVF